MADNTALLVGGAAVIGVGFYLWQKSKNAPPPAPTPGNPTPGYNIPADLAGTMQRTWQSAGSPGDPGGWVRSMQGVVPASAGAWTNVFHQWLTVIQITGGWPSNSQLTGWLQNAIQNYG